MYKCRCNIYTVVLLYIYTALFLICLISLADTHPDEDSSFLSDEAGETGLPGESSVSLEKVDEYGLDIACESSDKPFNHLTQAKYGTVSYRKIRRGQTRKKIEMFESMMQL